MIAFDTNLLVYAHREDSPFHDAARVLVKEAAEGKDNWAIAWPCVHEFLAIVTHPKIFKKPTPLDRALSQVDAWLGSPTLVLLGETDEYWGVLSRVAKTGKIHGAKIHDARIVALALLHGVDELLTADRDFSRFPELTCRNPLR